MSKESNCVFVFDIGKTHIKVTVLARGGEALYQNRTSNRVVSRYLYDSFDIGRTWEWLCEQLAYAGGLYDIDTISIATHGAAAALVDLKTGRTLLPVMDYEFTDYPDLPTDYDRLRPDFTLTGSPRFPAGLNLGRQLHWQSNILSRRARADACLLMYPQYWAWRLTGKSSSEVTSLGCHTDLWDVNQNKPTELLDTLGFTDALPPLQPAWEPVGTLSPELSEACNIRGDCKVLPGVHDSNAGYVAFLKYPKARRPTVISSGTWSVIMDPQVAPASLDATKDMLVNVDAQGNALCTARYMGGREFGLVCERLNTDIATTFTDDDVDKIIRTNTFVMPNFCTGAGPYPDRVPDITSDTSITQINGKAAATLYSALMLDDILRRLSPDTRRDIVIEGSFAANEVLCRVLAALNPDRAVIRHREGNGVTTGCFMLARWADFPESEVIAQDNPPVTPYHHKDLQTYAAKWRERARSE